MRTNNSIRYEVMNIYSNIECEVKQVNNYSSYMDEINEYGLTSDVIEHIKYKKENELNQSIKRAMKSISFLLDHLHPVPYSDDQKLLICSLLELKYKIVNSRLHRKTLIDDINNKYMCDMLSYDIQPNDIIDEYRCLQVHDLISNVSKRLSVDVDCSESFQITYSMFKLFIPYLHKFFSL